LVLWGFSASDAWAVGQAGVLVHWNGSTWTAVSSGTTAKLSGLRGAASNDVWAAGINQTPNITDREVVIHWNGTSWAAAPKPAGALLSAIWGRATDDLWGTSNQSAFHWNGTTWQLTTAASGPFGQIWGLDRNTLWSFSS